MQCYPSNKTSLVYLVANGYYLKGCTYSAKTAKDCMDNGFVCLVVVDYTVKPNQVIYNILEKQSHTINNFKKYTILPLLHTS